MFFALISLFERPISGETVALFPQSELPWAAVADRFVSAAFDLVPVWLVVFLVRRRGEGLGAVGLAPDRLGRDLLLGTAVGLVLVASASLGQVVAVNLGIQRHIIAAPLPGQWWGAPMVILESLGAAGVEEVVVAAFMTHRLLQMGWGIPQAVLASAAFRGSYHLYQGLGGFLGSFIMGVLFAGAFVRWRRTWPLIAAHFVIDVAAAILFQLARGHCVLGVCF